MDAYQGGVLSGAIVFPQVSALEAEQRKLERERPTKVAGPRVASADDFTHLDMDKQRAVVESLVEAVVVTKAERRGAPWTPDRVEVVWRSCADTHPHTPCKGFWRTVCAWPTTTTHHSTSTLRFATSTCPPRSRRRPTAIQVVFAQMVLRRDEFGIEIEDLTPHAWRAWARRRP